MAEFERISVTPPAGLRGYDAKLVSELYSIDTGNESKTQQQFGVEVDVNTIMRRYGITQTAPLGDGSGVYGDFTDIHDYESAVAKIEGARQKFMELPAEVRERFNNDPGVLIRKAQELPEAQFDALFVGDSAPEAPAPAERVP